MKASLFIILASFFWSFCYAQSYNIELLDNWQKNSLLVNSSQVRYNDCWGYFDGLNEYALAGTTEGTHALLISNSGKLLEVGYVPGSYQSSMVVHRDIKTYLNFAYAVCDEGESSLQIIDLSYLPDSISLVAEYSSRFSKVHNLFIDEINGILYACGPTHIDTASSTSLTYSLDVYSLADPVNPALIWEADPLSFPYVHDCFVKDGIAYLNCGDDGLRVYDFSIPSSPVFLQNTSFYQDQGYNHQGWMTPDGSKFVFGDETIGKKLKLCSVGNDHLITIERTFGTNYENGSIAHNVMLSNRFAYVAYYNEGLRIYDLKYTLPTEVAYYATYKDNSAFKMNGAWGVYSQLPSSRIIVSDRQYGVYLLDFNEDVFESSLPEEINVYPNPISKFGNLIIRLEEDGIETINTTIYSIEGKKLLEHSSYDQSYVEIPILLNSGYYYVRVSYLNYLEQEIEFVKKIEVIQ